MFDIFLDWLKRVLKSRLFPVTIIFITLFAVLIYRLFVLQIVQGPAIAQKFEYKNNVSRELKSTRGNIYDRKGKLLASNMLSYSVTVEDSTAITSNAERNAIIHRLIQIIESNGDTLDNPFYIRRNDKGLYDFTVDGAALTRFKKNVYAYLLDENGELTEEQKNATAFDVYLFMKNGTGDGFTDMFGISDDYTVDETLKIMSVRFAIFCNYPKFMTITVASNVTEPTVAEVMENNSILTGVKIEKQTRRVYHDSLYFAHIIGYTGLISADELTDMNNSSEYYNSTDVIGKTGLERKYENELGGKKGSETVAVNTSGKVIDILDRQEPVAGNDIYLTIDSDLQRASYHILENKIAGILASKLQPDLNYGTKGESASDILTPIYEVYYALINNNIIDINHLNATDATETEKAVYDKYRTNLNLVFNELNTLLNADNTITDNKAGDMEEFLKYYYEVLCDREILLVDDIPEEDATYRSYKNNKAPLSTFLQYAIANNYIDLSKLGVVSWYSSEELYQILLDNMWEYLQSDSTFNKKIYRNLVFSYKLTGREICLLLFDQGVLEYNKKDIDDLKDGLISAYEFMKDKIIKLDITPAMLALEPCSGSVVITDVKTGDILALVSYPSYDNNRLANKIDQRYYARLYADKSLPYWNRATLERTAPGSTFKMVTSFAALEEGVIGYTETVRDLGIFENIDPAPKCYVYPRSHGSVDLSNAIKVSCNYFFYEMGYRLSLDGSGRFNEQLGLKKLSDYASLFGLDTKSGAELSEMAPQISDKDSVRSAIGQGTNSYAPIQMSRYVTTLANRGINYDLTLLDRIVDKDGKAILNNDAPVYKDLTGYNPATWDAIQKGMYLVVNDPKGSVYDIFNNLGITVAGKTGTSQVSKVNPNNALFVSYAPYEDPEISVTAVIPNGHTSGNAAELARDIYRLYYNLEDPAELVVKEAAIPEHNIAAFSD